MNILVAEDEDPIAEGYKNLLERRGHKVTLTKDGQECIEEYCSRCNSMNVDGHEIKRLDQDVVKESLNCKTSTSETKELRHPFDVVILDYRMPRKDGLEAAKEILLLRPCQRLIFASAFVQETLMDSIKQLNMVVELLQKPFELEFLIDTVEDKDIYRKLEKLNVDIKKFKHWNPTHDQIKDLLDGLIKLRQPKSELSSSDAQKGEGNIFAKIIISNDSANSGIHESFRNLAAVDSALQCLGSYSCQAIYSYLEEQGIPKNEIVDRPLEFSKALHK